MVLPSEAREDYLGDEAANAVTLCRVLRNGKIFREEARHFPHTGGDQQLKSLSSLYVRADDLKEEATKVVRQKTYTEHNCAWTTFF